MRRFNEKDGPKLNQRQGKGTQPEISATDYKWESKMMKKNEA